MKITEVVSTLKARPRVVTRYPYVHTAGVLRLTVLQDGRVLGRVLPRRAK